MIGLVKGIVIDIEEQELLIENNNIGYIVHTTAQTCSEVELGDEVKLFTEMIVKEDSISLVGFASKRGVNLFNDLKSVSGVGLKSALGMMSSLTEEEIVFSIIEGNVKFLTRAPGIGKKTAERMILELKDKIGKKYGGGLSLSEVGELSTTATVEDSIVGDAKAGLISLGYTATEVNNAMKRIDKDQKTVEALIKEALLLLMRG